ncbi:cytochrome b [Phaeobacter gallaeciensis]|uniref:Cytochrome b n=2 Tax=Roseobacteraceae TaxID=2854170 RepID=A0A366X361_9RHOB|nr:MULTISPECIES: cytochrome b/b6 domain-containing protein [Roseobacteraceae]MBT3141355.1 cytochrome b/b6 domain-containing protein [Falsiruegeria litorea]RBW58419.1 cytochrome b [Phaeobacter gallaeciensis]
MNPSKYNNIQVALHWVVALLVLFMLVMGTFVLAQTPNSDPSKLTALRGHMVFGSVILLLTLLRLVWRRKSVQPDHAETGNALLDKLGVAAHYGLNLLTLLAAASGIGLALQAGLPRIVFGGQGILPSDFWAFTPRIAHGILTKLLAALIALHVVGALYHQFIIKDRLFGRIWFGKRDM